MVQLIGEVFLEGKVDVYGIPLDGGVVADEGDEIEAKDETEKNRGQDGETGGSPW
jgi:hypothetical protein